MDVETFLDNLTTPANDEGRKQRQFQIQVKVPTMSHYIFLDIREVEWDYRKQRVVLVLE